MSSRSISAHIFYHFYPTLNLLSFISHAHDSRTTRQNTRHHRIGTKTTSIDYIVHKTDSSRWFNSLILPSNHGSPDLQQRSCRTPRPFPLPPTCRSTGAVQPCAGPKGILSVSRHYETRRILPGEDRPGYHNPVEDPLPALPPVGPGLRQLRHSQDPQVLRTNSSSAGTGVK